MNCDDFNDLPTVVSMNHTSGYIATSLIVLSVAVETNTNICSKPLGQPQVDKRG